MRVLMQFTRTGDTYAATYWAEGREEPIRLEGLALGEAAEVEIDGRRHRLGGLVEHLLFPRLADYEVNGEDWRGLLDGREQVEIGRHLFRETLGRLPEPERRRILGQEGVALHLLCADELIPRLPWSLLAEAVYGTYLSQRVLTPVLSGRTLEGDGLGLEGVFRDVELPPNPRLLLVTPEPAGVSPTEADHHVRELEHRLGGLDRWLVLGKNLRRVRSWAEFVGALQGELAPHLVYFYGHGEADGRQGRLVFQDGEGRRLDQPIAEFARRLGELATPPLVAYVNCCQGDAAGMLGAGRQLEARIPAVLTNRTVADIPAAQAQGRLFWEQIIGGIAPHQALQRVYAATGGPELTVEQVCWMTPVLHGHYREWSAHPPQPVSRQVHDPHWNLKVDRTLQYPIISDLTRKMVRFGKPKAQSFVWYGREGEGVDIFRERLDRELFDLSLPDGRTELSDTAFRTLRPEWPATLARKGEDFRDMVLNAFGVSDLAAIPRRIAEWAREEEQPTALVYLAHEPVRIRESYTSRAMIEESINPQTLRAYLEWWDSLLADPKLGLLEAGQHLLIGLPFISGNPPALLAWMQSKAARLDQLALSHLGVRVLKELEEVARQDLLHFLQEHNILLPPERREYMLDAILKETQGHYEQTIKALQEWIDKIWDIPLPKDDDDFDPTTIKF
jgi:hypothetical protein